MKCELDCFACFAKMFYENHELQNFVENKILFSGTIYSKNCRFHP